MRASPPQEHVVPAHDAIKLPVLHIAGWSFLALFCLTRVIAPVVDLDGWHEMALIRESLRAGHLLTADVYAYTPTLRPVIDHEWGAGALLYFAACRVGAWSVVVLKYLVVFLAALAVVRCALRRSRTFEEIVVLLPPAIFLFGLGASSLRAHAYSFLFFAVLLYFLELDAQGKRLWIVLWPVLFVVWVNLHGGWVIGLAALGLYWIEQALRRRPHIHLLGAAALALLVTPVNPYGGAYLVHMWAALRMPRPEISEWLSIWHAGPVYLGLFAVTLIVAAYAILACGWRSARCAPILAAMAAGAVLHLRILPFYAVAWAAYAPSYVHNTALGVRIRRLFRKPEPATMVCIVLALFFAVMACGVPFWGLLVPNGLYPVGALRYLRDQNFRGNLMTPFQQGAYISWRMYPEVKVSMDSRYETAFSAAIFNENLRFYAARPGWQETLARYPTDLVLTFRRWFLTPVLPAAGWKLVYVDRAFEMYERPGLDLPLRDDSAKDFYDTFP